MIPSSDARSLESIESEWILLKRLEAHPKQEALAASAGLDKGTLSAFKNLKGAIRATHLKLLLRALNLKLVPADARCVSETTFREMARMAGKALKQPELLWDEEGE